MDTLCSESSNLRLHDVAVARLPKKITSDYVDEPWDPEALRSYGYNHKLNAQELLSSAKSCKLC